MICASNAAVPTASTVADSAKFMYFEVGNYYQYNETIKPLV